MARRGERKRMLKKLHQRLPFGWGNITKLVLTHFFASLYFYAPVGTLYLQGKGLNYVQINSMWGIIMGTMFLTEVPAGIIADRMGRKRAINIALGLQVLGEVIYIFADGYLLFALAAFVGGLGFAFGSGCIEALVYDSLRAKKREAEMTKAMGLISAGQRLANVFAFAVGGIFMRQLTQTRFVTAIALTAFMVTIGWWLTFALQEAPVEQEDGQSTQSPLALLSDGVKLLQKNPQFRRLAWLSLATLPFRDYLSGLYQPYFVSVGVSPTWLGLALALASGLSVLGARYAYCFDTHLSTRWSLLLSTGLPGVLYLILAGTQHPTLVVIVFLLLYASTSLKLPILSAYLNQHIESHNRATVLSLLSMASGLYEALMGLLIGHLADRSLPWAFVFMGTAVLGGALLFGARGNKTKG